jgi:hypothetical protein
MLAWQMKGKQSPLLNGFPLGLIVPGWYSTYWVKMLNDVVSSALEGPRADLVRGGVERVVLDRAEAAARIRQFPFRESPKSPC